MRCSLQFVSDWFVTREWMLWMLYDDYCDSDNWDDEDTFLEW